jgi:glycosyltransferase involved in cell wall biosynthesis
MGILLKSERIRSKRFRLIPSSRCGSWNAYDVAVVLDTGSTDETAAILAANGVQVHTEMIEPWRFDAARNRALELVPPDTDICVKLDLDECLAPGWRAALEAAWVPGRTSQAWYNYTWSWKSPGVPDQRFFQNHCHARHGFTWRHRCHEALYFSGNSPHEVTVPAMRIEHHPDPTKSRANYLPLIETEHQAEPSARSRFYLAREYYFCRRFPEAVTLFHEYLEHSQYPAERGVACWHLYMITRQNRWAYRAIAESPNRQHLLLGAKVALGEREYSACLHWCELAINASRTPVFGEQAVDDSEIFDTAADCAWQAGQRAAAFGYLERASQLAPRRERTEKYITWVSAGPAVT